MCPIFNLRQAIFCRHKREMSKELGRNKRVTENVKVCLRVIQMSIKSYPMKSLRNVQKRTQGTLPTIIGQHTQLMQCNLQRLQEYVFEKYNQMMKRRQVQLMKKVKIKFQIMMQVKRCMSITMGNKYLNVERQ